MSKFPSPEWLDAFDKKLNSDPNYARIAQKWEWDLVFIIQPGGELKSTITYYFDLWHGKCRKAEQTDANSEQRTAAFVLKAPYPNFARIVGGKLDPLQAMLTRRLQVQGPMAVMLRNVPTVMDFVRCAREITDSFL